VMSVDPDAIPILRFGYKAGSGLTPNLIASAFVHAGWVHLIGNMLFLWLAGSALEDRLGRIRFAILPRRRGVRDPVLGHVSRRAGDDHRRCVGASAKDAGSLRLLASRVILDLARAGDDTKIFELYRAISQKLVQLPLTDGAFLAIAKAAEALNFQRTYVEIPETALREQPGSRLAPDFQARLSATRR